MTTLEKIVKAAKAMKKAHPKKYAKWTDYVKAASRQVKPVKKAAPKKKIGAVKKSAPARSTHKDTKSHNVKIHVVSGIESGLKKQLTAAQRELTRLQTEQKRIPAVKKVIAKLKKVVK